MKKNITLTLISIALVCSCAFAQKPADKKATPKPKPSAEDAKKAAAAQEEAGMKAWMAYMTPGKMHEMIAASDGEWKEDVTMWMAPGAPPIKSMSSCINTMIMGGRYQESKHKGDMNGMPFEGTNILGYDNARKIFVSSWIDNMGTGIMYMEGKYDEATRTVHFSGKSVDPMTGKEMHVREDFKNVDDHTQLMQMYTTQNGKEFKTLEIKFMR